MQNRDFCNAKDDQVAVVQCLTKNYIGLAETNMTAAELMKFNDGLTDYQLRRRNINST